ncbi:hypothetical protein KO561_03310 [Radiobacillus kanasensis]|uniref:hypothetical protein n=1 Tax=Radiobacillus kanasensis TaxID=2844358 RepID=UPI001E4E3D61|nr:hypothetical protein [Radiobacillus kanasensis]UFU00006.1 hypothetical protein KO561_03310 [Radiobacillus kanasensis]
MRQWRVGSISMGAALIGLGIVLFLATLNKWDLSVVSLSWLPIILIILGMEMIVYLFLSKKEQPIVKYDILSIVFISVLGVLAIGLFVLSSSGLIGQFTQLVHAKESQVALPKVEKALGEDIEQIVIQSESGNDVTIEANASDQLDLFGTYVSTTMDEPIEKEDYANITQSGNTLYVQLLRAPMQDWLDDGMSTYQITISLPANLDVEVRSYIQHVQIPMDLIQGNWYIQSAEEVVASGWQESKVSFIASTSHVEELVSVNWDKQEARSEKREWEDPHGKTLEKNVKQATAQVSIADTQNIIVKH